MPNIRAIFQKLKGQEGASLIEFALVAPVFFMIVIAGIEFMTVVWEQYSLNYILSKTARHVFINPDLTEGEIVDYLEGSDVTLPTIPDYVVEVLPSTSVTITGTLNHNFIFYPGGTYQIEASIVQPLPPS